MSKSRDAFRTISEVADWLETPAHVLRFWESKFSQVKPVKRAGGRRYYRPADMELLGGIKKLLHEDGMTIKGVQKVLREQGVRYVSGLSAMVDGDDDDTGALIEDAPFEDVAEARGTSEILTFPSAAPVPETPARTPPQSPAEGREAADSAPDAAATADVEPAIDGLPADTEIPPAETVAPDVPDDRELPATVAEPSSEPVSADSESPLEPAESAPDIPLEFDHLDASETAGADVTTETGPDTRAEADTKTAPEDAAAHLPLGPLPDEDAPQDGTAAAGSAMPSTPSDNHQPAGFSLEDAAADKAEQDAPEAPPSHGPVDEDTATDRSDETLRDAETLAANPAPLSPGSDERNDTSGTPDDTRTPALHSDQAPAPDLERATASEPDTTQQPLSDGHVPDSTDPIPSGPTADDEPEAPTEDGASLNSFEPEKAIEPQDATTEEAGRALDDAPPEGTEPETEPPATPATATEAEDPASVRSSSVPEIDAEAVETRQTEPTKPDADTATDGQPAPVDLTESPPRVAADLRQEPEEVPSKPVGRPVDLPDFTTQAEATQVPGPLTHLARIDSLSKAQAQELAAPFAALNALREKLTEPLS